jgi:hypothetical protein
MSNLRPIELRLVDDLFETSPGYVLSFSNRTFAEFFAQEVGIDIYDEAYADIGTSKGKRFRAFLQKGQRAAVAKALAALWEYRDAERTRSGISESVPNARQQLSAIIERLGGQSLVSARTASGDSIRTRRIDFAPLTSEFTALHALEPQPRGYAFERFLKRLFDACGLEAREAFRIRGEQIDGSFQLGDAPYLLEARWQNISTDAAQLRSFQGKVEDRPTWTRGLFVSYSGFSVDGLAAFGGRRIVLMEGLDLHDALRRRLSIADVISAKVRRASETGQVFTRVCDLFPE